MRVVSKIFYYGLLTIILKVSINITQINNAVLSSKSFVTLVYMSGKL